MLPHLKLVMAVAMTVTTAVTGIAPTPDPAQVPVITYHHLALEPEEGNPAVVTVAEFERQMQLLQADGFSPISVAQLDDWLAGRKRLPPEPVLITFDDGYRSNYEHAYPILKRMGWKATLFLVTGKVGRQPGKYPYASWSELQEMVATRVFEVQAHAHDGHREVYGTPAYIAWTEEGIRSDFREIQHQLLLNRLPAATALAYPYGAHDAETEAAAAAEGFALAFQGGQACVQKGDSRVTLRRLSVTPGLTDCQFRALVSGEEPMCD